MSVISQWYKCLVASLKITDVLPELTHDVEVCRLDAERERLAREYQAADGALLRQIAGHLRHDGSGRWSRYIAARKLPGGTTEHDRMRIAEGVPVPVMCFDRASVHKITHCPDCYQLWPRCLCGEYEGGAS